ncbi:MAG: flagellar brake protein [Thermodesulfobacteriota bacterium]
MDAGTRPRPEAEGQRLSLEIGARVSLRFEGQEKVMKALFVGMDPGSFIVLRLSGLDGWHDHVFEGNRVNIRYVSSGMVYGFQSICQGFIFRQNLVLGLLSYPETVKAYDLRQDQRLDSCLPAALTMGIELYHGYVLDLSPSGCGFVLTRLADKAAFQGAVGEEVKLAFSLPGQDEPQIIACRIKNIRFEEESLMIGLQLDLKTEATYSLDLFRHFVQEHMEAD